MGRTVAINKIQGFKSISTVKGKCAIVEAKHHQQGSGYTKDIINRHKDKRIDWMKRPEEFQGKDLIMSNKIY